MRSDLFISSSSPVLFFTLDFSHSCRIPLVFLSLSFNLSVLVSFFSSFFPFIGYFCTFIPYSAYPPPKKTNKKTCHCMRKTIKDSASHVILKFFLQRFDLIKCFLFPSKHASNCNSIYFYWHLLKWCTPNEANFMWIKDTQYTNFTCFIEWLFIFYT